MNLYIEPVYVGNLKQRNIIKAITKIVLILPFDSLTWLLVVVSTLLDRLFFEAEKTSKSDSVLFLFDNLTKEFLMMKTISNF